MFFSFLLCDVYNRHCSHINTYCALFFLAPANKRLALIYLANEVSQQSRIKKWNQFTEAFAKRVPGALGYVYRQASADIKPRIKRVADVWRQRQVFPEDVLDKIDAALLDTRKPGGGFGFGSGKFGDSSSSSSAPELPPILSKLASLHKNLTAATGLSNVSLKTANDDYQSIVESDNLPAPKEYASKLALLEPRLLSAHVNLTKRLNARREFIDQLISLTRSNEVLLNEDEELLKELDAKKAKVHELKTELVDMIGEDAVDTVSSNSRSETPIDNWASRGSGRNLGGSAFKFNDEAEADEIGARTTTPPAPPLQGRDNTFGGFSIVDDNDTFENGSNHKVDTSVPEYVESSDESDSESRPNKRAKVDDKASTSTDTLENGATPSLLGALDPKVAQFLSSIAKGGSFPGSS